MRKFNVSAMIFSTIMALITFIMTFAVVCPQILCERVASVGDPDCVLLPKDKSAVLLGNMDSNGAVTLAEDMKVAVVQFETPGDTIKCVEVKYSDESKESISFACESTVDGTFGDFEYVYANMWKNEDTALAVLPSNNYTAIRVWFPKECTLESISLYSTTPTQEPMPIKHKPWRYIMVAGITIAVFVVAFILDAYFKWSKRICDYVKNKYLRITTGIIVYGSAILLGILAEIIFRAVVGYDSAGNAFNNSSCIVFCVIFICIAVFILEYKNFGKAPEKAVFLIILTAGLLIIFTQPFSHNSWDIDSHYPWAVQNSFFGTAYYTKADVDIKTMTTFTVNSNLVDKELMKTALNDIGEIAVESVDVEFMIAHVPAGVFIAVARMFGADFYTRFLFGEIANILVYATVCYFAVKKLKSGKMIVSAIALLPTSVFLASSYSYDYWVTAFSLLGISYFISELEQPDKPITICETIIMCGALMLAALPKQTYVILFVLPLFMRKNHMSTSDKKRYFCILLLIFALTFAIFASTSLSAISGTGDTRGGAEVNPKGQILYILNNPFKYAKTLITFLMGYLSIDGMYHYISFFAYLGYGRLHTVYTAIFCIVALTDKDSNNRFKGTILIRIVAALLFIGGAAIMASALYVAFTPVGLDQINGCQPRYIIPLLAPVLLTIANPGLKIIKNKKIYNAIILAMLTITTMYEIITTISLRTI